jgi:hypothetical protein
MRRGESLERDVQRVYSFLLNMRDEGVVVGRSVFINGKSGVQHEVDVYYEFAKAGLRHRVAIECKDWSSPVSKGQIQEFESKLRDIGGTLGVVISRSGYQVGAAELAKYHTILALRFEDLPSMNVLLAERLATVALPDETYVGEPFWIIMEVREGRTTGSHFATQLPGFSEPAIPLTFSRVHAERLFREADLDPERWAVRGLPRFAFRAFLVTLDLYERMGRGGAMICFLPPGADAESRFVGVRVSRELLIREYYGAPLPSIAEIG